MHQPLIVINGRLLTLKVCLNAHQASHVIYKNAYMELLYLL